MSPKEPADVQLERVLHILPNAARPGGVSLAELAAALAVDEKRVLRDLEEVTARAYYLEPPIDIEITIERDRVTVWTTGEFRRPVRLTPREALALTLGLRLLADGADAARAEALRALAARLDLGIATSSAAALAADFAMAAGDPEGQGILALLREAARDHRPCRLRYLKPSDVEPEERVLHPFALVHSGGRWYALGESPRAGAVRAFRLDRMLAVSPLEGTFEIPEGFDPRQYIDGGDVFRAEEPIEARVRYSPRIARWIEEHSVGETADDGSVVVTHAVADPGWLVRHVLYHGPDAEVIAPPAVRLLMHQRMEQILESQEEEWSEVGS